MSDRQKLLIVDDEHMNLRILAGMLEQDYEVLLAKNGEQALARVANEPDLDLILLDVMMPDMDGYEVLRRLKENPDTYNIPVIFVTALSSVDDEANGLMQGAVDYISKPLHSTMVKLRVATHMRLVRQRKMLENLVGQDGLTEICNRRRFDELLDHEWRRCRRQELPLSLAMVDIDYFKAYNDHYGHLMGDEALRAVAHTLARGLKRPADCVARFGGEEFVLLLPDTPAVGAQEQVERLRQEVLALAVPHEASEVFEHLIISIGGATVLPAESSSHSLLKAADAKLYEAKQAGRNRSVWAD